MATLFREALKSIAGVLQLCNFFVERFDTSHRQFVRANAVLAFIQGQQFVYFVQREACCLSLPDKHQPPQIFTPVPSHASAIVARWLRQQTLTLVEAYGLHTYAACRSELSNG